MYNIITIERPVHWNYFRNLKIQYEQILFNKKYNFTEQLKAQLGSSVQKFLEYKSTRWIPPSLVKDGRKDEIKKDKISRKIK